MTKCRRMFRSICIPIAGAAFLAGFVLIFAVRIPANVHNAFLVPPAVFFGMVDEETVGGTVAPELPTQVLMEASKPTISAAPVLLVAGAIRSNVTIATVSDAEHAPETLFVTLNGGLSATENGVTVSNIRVDRGGVVMADVIAADGAQSVSFELTVTTLRAESAWTTLTMIVPSICPGGGSWSQQGHPTGPFSNYGFGQSVAITGDTAVVGVPGGGTDRGFAHIFVRSGSVWTELLRINPSDSEHGDHFGVSVGIDHDTIIVGASLDDSTGGVDSGSAYVFVRSGTTWIQQQKLTPSDGAASDEFGHSVAISEESVIVGAFSDDNVAGANAGSAYVFTRSGTVWSQQQKIVASDGASGDIFGASSAISGETAIIGAQADDDAGSGSGSAYVFTRSGTLWSQQQKLTASDGASNDAFGNSVSISDDTVVVGASIDDNAAGTDAGSAYIFARSGTVWSQQQKLTASDGAVSDRFAFTVAISGETVVIGADSDDNAFGSNAGAGYIFRRYGDFWAEEQKLTGSVSDSIRFGSSVAIDGDSISIGAPFEDAPGGLTDAGAAYFFTRSCRPIISTLPVVRSPGGGVSNSTIGNADDGEQEPDTLSVIVNGGASATQNGVTVSNIGISPSGVVTADVVAVAGAADASFTLTVIDGSGLSSRATLAVIVLSQCPSTGGWSQLAQPTASDGAANDNFGISVAISGDTVIVGAQGDDNAGGADAGAVYVYVRSGTAWTQQQKLTASDGAANDRFGDNIAISGNTVIVGAYLDSNALGANAGGAYVFTRNGTVWTQQQKLTASDGAAGDQFSVSVTVSGDTAVIGAWAEDNALGTDAGSAYVFTRNGSVWTQQQKLTAPDGAASDNFGYAAALSGDTVILSAIGDDTVGGTDTGSVYAFTRNGAVWSTQQKLTASNGAANDFFGVSIALSGDTAVVGATLDDTAAGVDAGSAYVFARSGTVWSQQQNLTSSDAAAGDRFARSVSISGDMVIVGADSDDNAGGTDAGSAYIFMRSGGIWSQPQKLTASNGAATDNFGFASAISGDTAVVGAPFDDTLAGGDVGSAYIFNKVCPAPTATSTPTNTATNTPTFTPTPTNTPTNTPTATPAGTPAISGTVTYGNAISGPTPPRFVSNVTVTGAGSPSVSTTTDAPGATAGQYSLTGFGAGSYTVTPTKMGGVNNITSFDAARIAQHVSGISFLTGNALVVADVSGNGSVTSFDAANIANFVVVASPAGSTGTWRFYTIPNVPFPPGATATSRTYASVTTNITGQDYTGLLMGEVSGNWNNTGARPVGSRRSQSAVEEEPGSRGAGTNGPERDIAVTAPSLVSPPNNLIIIPVSVEGVAEKGIISYEFDLRYDPAVIQPQAWPVDLAGTVSSKFSVAANAEEPGLLRVAVYGPVPMDSNGALLQLRFTAIGAPGSVSPLTWERMMFNEGGPETMAADGQVKLSPAAPSQAESSLLSWFINKDSSITTSWPKTEKEVQ